jgi:hypothetical protein
VEVQEPQQGGGLVGRERRFRPSLLVQVAQCALGVCSVAGPARP